SFRSAESRPIPPGKQFRARTGQSHVLAAVQHESGELDGIKDTLDGNDGAGFQRAAIHENGVHLNVAITIEVRADTRIEGWIVLELHDCLLTCIQRGAPISENIPSSIQTRQNSILARLFKFGRNRPGATVNDECNVFHKESI